MPLRIFFDHPPAVAIEFAEIGDEVSLADGVDNQEFSGGETAAQVKK